MSIKKSTVNSTPYWRELFIEIALRAIRKLHIEYGMWGLGQKIDSSKDFKKLNIGLGIQVALETAVCAAITQEFISSRFTNGILLNETPRYYEINREVCFTQKNKENIKIDIFLNRYEVSPKIRHLRYPVLIEAKRAHYFSPDISTGSVGHKRDNWQAIRNDIKRLIELRNNLNSYNISLKKFNGNLKGAFLYILIWGIVTTPNLDIDYPEDIKQHFKKKKVFTRWMPLSWSQDSPKVKDWLWVTLAPIEPYPKKPDIDNPDNWFS